MTPVRAVFLDVGGTLLHLDRDFILSCLAERGITRTTADFAKADDLGRAAMAARLRSDNPGDDALRWGVYARAMLDHLECLGDDEIFVRKRIGERNAEGRLWSRTEHGTLATMQRLKKLDYVVGIVSNSNGRVHEFLEHAGLTQYLDFVVDSGTVGVEKPNPRIFEIACARAGVQPDEAVHVGDLYEIDVVGARAAGITPILIDPQHVYDAPDCDRIRAMPELLTWLTTNSGNGK